MRNTQAHAELPVLTFSVTYSAQQKVCSISMEFPGKARVMIVEGVPLTRLGLVALINQHPKFEVCAQSGEVRMARQICQESKPDLIVLDLILYYGDGLELLRDFGRLHPPARALVISDREDAHSLQRAFRLGARGYMTKQDDPEEVISGLECVQGGGLFTSRRVAHLLLEQMASGRLAASEEGVAVLSDRELQVFRLIGSGLGAMAVARELNLSVKTIETHRQRIKDKLRLASGAELNRRASQWVDRNNKVRT